MKMTIIFERRDVVDNASQRGMQKANYVIKIVNNMNKYGDSCGAFTA